MKKTIDIYTVMQTSEKDRDLCYNFTSFKEANKQFEKFVQMWEKANKVKAKGWTSPAAPYQLKVSRIGDITLYLCKESIEIEISKEVKEPIVNEPEFKPFFCANNCFNESIKHTPFGILKDSNDKYYTILDISKDGISILSDDHSISTISFKFASTLLKYADGNPFGYTDPF